MSEPTSFLQITRAAFLLVWNERRLLWFSIPTGLFIAMSSSLGHSLQQSAPAEMTNPELWRVLLETPRFWLTIALVLLVALAQATLRGPLLTLVEQYCQHSSSLTDRKPLTWTVVQRSARLAALFELGFWAFLVFLAFTLALPTLVASTLNPQIVPSITQLAILLFLALSIYLYLVKELSLLYALLGPVQLKSALDLGFRLFRKQTLSVYLFFSYLVLLTLAFTLFLEALSYLLTTAPVITKGPIAWWVALPLGLFFIFDQALRLLYFRSIAATPKQPAPKAVALSPTESPTSISQG